MIFDFLKDKVWGTMSHTGTSLAAEGNHQADKLNDTSERIDDASNAAGGVYGLVTSVTVKENQGIHTSKINSSLTSGEKPLYGFEINNDVLDVDKGMLGVETIMTVERNQQTNVSEVSSCLDPGTMSNNEPERKNGIGYDVNGVTKVSKLSSDLASRESLNDDAEARKIDVKDETTGFGTSKMTSPMKGENCGAVIETNVIRNDTDEFDSSKMPSSMKNEVRGAVFGTDIVSDKHEDLDFSKIISLVGTHDDNPEIKTSTATDEGGEFDASKLNSTPILSKCTYIVDGVLLSAEKSEGQTESKRLAELRERKKSKYLSPPYVNLSKRSKSQKGSDIEYSAFLGDWDDSNPVSKLGALSPRVSRSGSKRKRITSVIKSLPSSGNLQEIRASTDELLSDLHLVAVDCLYPFENAKFDPTEIFFTVFRSSVFHGESNEASNDVAILYEKDVAVLYEKDVSLQVESSNNSNLEPKKRKKKEKTTSCSTNLILDDLYDVNVDVAPTNSFTVKPQRKKRVKDITVAARQTDSLSLENKKVVSNIVNTNGMEMGSLMEDACILADKPGPKKRGRKKSIDLSDAIPDENTEKKKRRRRLKDGTYADGPNVSTPILTNDIITNAKPISLEVCLQNVDPVPPCSSNTDLTPGAKSAPLGEIREKLEMMTSMLENSGGNISSELKLALENEIQGLLEKVKTMPSSSS